MKLNSKRNERGARPSSSNGLLGRVRKCIINALRPAKHLAGPTIVIMDREYILLSQATTLVGALFYSLLLFLLVCEVSARPKVSIFL